MRRYPLRSGALSRPGPYSRAGALLPAATLGLHGVASMQMQFKATSANFREKATRCRFLASSAGDEDLAKELATSADRYDQAALDLDLTAYLGPMER